MNTIKIEKSVKEYILTEIKNEKGKTVTIDGTKRINAIRKIAEALKIEIEVYNPKGEYNGYGYDKLPKVCEFPKLKIKNYLNKKIEIKKEAKKLTHKELVEKWCNRLVTLTNITIEEARKIAEEKEEYKEEKIWEMEARQVNNFSKKREKLINKMERENPLRYIKDGEHAQSILIASDRHNNTNYEDQLDEAREKAIFGIIDRSEVKEYARANYS